MERFGYVRAHDKTEAIALARRAKTAQQGADIRYIAGGTTLVDLMKLDVERPQTLIDITHLPLTEVKAAPGGGVEIGAMVRNSDLAHHPLIQRDYPVLSEALLSGASAQLRTRRRRAETCSSAPGACTFGRSPCPATSASPARAAARSWA
jgi:xanthine dehydrogenase YagS FAD-binding subunit